MKIAPNIISYEFIGTKAKIARGKPKECVGLSGKIIDETRNTFVIMHKSKRKRIIKNSTVFHFYLSDGTIVEINGNLLIGRPEDRLKKRIKRLW